MRERRAFEDVRFAWRGEVTDDELVTLTQSHGGTAQAGWWDRIRPHSLGWVTARLSDATLPVGDTDLQFARDEGERFESVAAWREAHDRFWRSYAGEIRDYLGDPHWDVTDETLYVAERFRLVELL